MEPLPYVRTKDSLPADGPIDLAPIIATWINTHTASRGIVKVVLSNNEGALAVQAFGACDPSPCDWGERTPAVFAENVGSRTAKTISVVYDFGFMETSLQVFTKLGVMVVAVFTRFKDGSSRADYFDREFFYKANADEASAS